MIVRFLFKKIGLKSPSNVAKKIINICIIAVCLSVFGFLVGLGFINGFQQTLVGKFENFSGNYLISPYLNNSKNSHEIFNIDSSLKFLLNNLPSQANYYPSLEIPAIIKYKKEISSIVIKGISMAHFKKTVTGFLTPNSDSTLKGKNIIISTKIAQLLNIKNHESLNLFFLHEDFRHPTVLKFNVCGFYNTHIEEIDQNIIFMPIEILQKILSLNENQFSSCTIWCPKSSEKIVKSFLNKKLPFELQINSTQDQFKAIYDWLNFQNVNKTILIVIISIVAFVNVLTCILVLIFDRLKFFGVLLFLGLSFKKISQLLAFYGVYIIFSGIVLGLLLTGIFAFIQNNFPLIKLDPEIYYLSYPPIELSFSNIFISLAWLIFITFVAISLPIVVLRFITPIEAMKKN